MKSQKRSQAFVLSVALFGIGLMTISYPPLVTLDGSAHANPAWVENAGHGQMTADAASAAIPPPKAALLPMPDPLKIVVMGSGLVLLAGIARKNRIRK